MYMLLCACLLIMHTLFSCVHSRKCRSKKGLARERRKGEEAPIGGRFWNKSEDQDSQEITLISANNVNELLLHSGLTSHLK